MSTLKSKLLEILCCPDDHGSFVNNINFLECSICHRQFQINDNIIDLRPSKKFDSKTHQNIEHDYDSYYQSLSTSGKPDESKNSFGVAYSWVSEGLVKEITSNLRGKIDNKIVCDIGAGTGDYSVKLAKYSKILFHCDLDVNGIKLAQENAKNIDNLFFLICDYFFLPFKNESVDVVYSIDVVERGKEHDKSVIKEMSRLINNKGYCIFDCHAKERSKLTHRIPKSITQYSKEEIKNMTQSFFKIDEILGTGYMPQIRIWSASKYKILNPLAKIVQFPPARWLLICKSL